MVKWDGFPFKVGGREEGALYAALSNGRFSADSRSRSLAMIQLLSISWRCGVLQVVGMGAVDFAFGANYLSRGGWWIWIAP